MSNLTNRVFLPGGNTLYVSDDNAGDARFADLIDEGHGNAKVEVCDKRTGKSLQDLKPFIIGTVEKIYDGSDDVEVIEANMYDELVEKGEL